MALLDTIRKNRKKAPKQRLTVMIGETTKGQLFKLSEQRTEKTATDIVIDAIAFAFKHDMYKEEREAENALNAERGVPLAEAPKGSRRPIAMDKKTWCEQYGGTCDGVNCVYDKYEVTLMGRVVKNRLSQPLRSMPDNEADFCKSVLGGFSTVSEAEVAFEEQTEEETA